MTDVPWQLPGFAIEELLGFGASGEVWAACEIASGERVALKRLRAGAGAEDRERLAREAALLPQLASPHVVRLRRVVADGASTVLVLDLAAGGSLAALLAVRGRLVPAEVVTVLAPLAQTLADLHERGVVHGDVTPANVLFSADGRPMLGDLGVARLVGEPPVEPQGVTGFADPAVVAGAVPGPASDVYGLAAVGVAALTGEPPRGAFVAAADVPGAAADALSALLAALQPALDPAPAARPAARELAAAVRAVCAPAPVRLVRAVGPVAVPPTHQVRAAQPSGGGPDQVPPRGPRSAGLRPTGRRARGAGRRRGAPLLDPPRLRRRLVVAAVTLAALTAAVAAGQAWAARTQPTAHRLAAPPAPLDASPTALDAPPIAASTPSTATTADRGHWRVVLSTLDRRRADAMSRDDETALRRVYVGGSPALSRDLATLRSLVAAGEHPRGLRFDLVEVTVEAQAAETVTLRVVDRLAAYDVVAADGRLLRHDPGRGARAFVVVLVRDGAGGWLIRDERVR